MSTSSKPRILLITRNLPPLVGGMERLMQQLSVGMAEYSQLTIIGPKGCARHLPAKAQVFEVSEKLAPYLLASTWRAIFTCRTTKFDLVIGGSGLVAPTLRLLARLYGCKTLVYLHGLDIVVDNFLYQKVFSPCIRAVDQIVVNSQNTRKLALDRGVPQNRIRIVNPGTELPQPQSPNLLAEFRSRNHIAFEKIIVFVGRMTKRKGLSRFIELSLPEILRQEPDSGLIVVGDNPENSLNRLGEQEDILKLVAQMAPKNRILFLGQLSDKDLRTCYELADVQIFPLIDVPGDVEGFGMVAIEAAALGTPTVAFSRGGVADAISESNGYLVTPDRYDLFAESVLDSIRRGAPSSSSCINHAKGFSWEITNEKFHGVITDLISQRF
jgi:phosphatidyl-myo-inositol dimannoside synthase